MEEWTSSGLYPYAGPEAIRLRVAGQPGGTLVGTVADLEAYLRGAGDEVTLTYVIDAAGRLRLAERHSEHVACAQGEPVRAAGELFLARAAGRWRVAEVSNQSTGYRPDPSCWPEVARVLDEVGLEHPGRFTLALTFRCCLACGQLNVIKDGWLSCAVCGAELPA
jgi:hypothetical protein